MSDSPVTYEQRVVIQYLQPPALPPPGPIIIEEVRPPQPPPPPPIVIRQHPPRASTPPPLILRELPPKPPLHGCSEKYIRELSPIPIPPRSVRIEVLPRLPEKPRDIRIERWLPYGPQPEREVFVKRAPPAIEYPKPTHTIVNHKDVDTRINRKFENRDVIRENPYDYKARYGTSLLDSTILAQEALKAGVNEDISPSSVTPLINTNTYGNTVHYPQPYERINQGCSSSSETDYKGIQGLVATQTTTVGETSCLSSSSKHIGYSSSVDSGSRMQSEIHIDDASASTTNTKCDEILKQTED
ncbi:unnamed protein product [Rotaria sp. Silwood1]|nr:unnamed protein product [Rotaria sp. Silwood1]CAF1499705.1 unnamed protein product [Rotaria sp. Silwood1]CAF3681701.1 unnamed protein product [Rotaria sp. Silwood1]CAF4892058.1 unnamed protein product [Rotaria sp. Silwood1]